MLRYTGQGLVDTMSGSGNKILEFITKTFFGDARSATLSKNILLSFFVKGYAMAIQFVLVPVTLKYLNAFNYGIWLVLASMLEWFSYFDIGIQHGLRNRLTESLASDNLSLSKKYVSTAYLLVTLIFSAFILLFIVINPFINWPELLSVPKARADELLRITNMVFAFFSLRFILSLITAVMFARQHSGLNSLMGPLGSTLSLVGIILGANWIQGDLFGISFIFSAAPVGIMLLFTIYLFSFNYKEIRPSFKFIDLSHAKPLLGLGFSFFIIQVSMLVLYSTSNLILTHYFGPEEVTTYNIAYKYFTIPIMVSAIVTMPYWSGFTDAYTRGETEWIKKSIFKLNIISWLLVLSQLILFILSDTLVRLWVGGDVQISLGLKLSLMLYSAVYLIITPFNIFINGVSKIRLQLYAAVVSIIITIPISLFFIKVLHLGPPSVMLAIVCSTIPSGVLWIIQYRKIINGRATGVWNQ
jgi:O-antigen/teichoic acid export membrane protein